MSSIFGVFKHGRIKAVAVLRTVAESYIKEHGCDGSQDGRCADWQDEGNICNQITEIEFLDPQNLRAG